MESHSVSDVGEEKGVEEGAENGVAEEGREEGPSGVVEEQQRPQHACGDGDGPCDGEPPFVHYVPHYRDGQCACRCRRRYQTVG